MNVISFQRILDFSELGVVSSLGTSDQIPDVVDKVVVLQYEQNEVLPANMPHNYLNRAYYPIYGNQSLGERFYRAFRRRVVSFMSLGED